MFVAQWQLAKSSCQIYEHLVNLTAAFAFLMDFSHWFVPLVAQGTLIYFCYRLADRQVLYVSPAYAQVLGGNPAAINAMLEDLRRGCQEGVNLIRDFVDQEFSESSNINLNPTRLDLVERLGAMMEAYQQRQHAAEHHFSF